MLRDSLAMLTIAALVLLPIRGIAETESDGFVKTANYFLLSGTTLENKDTVSTLASFDLLVLPAEAQLYNKAFFTEARRQNPDIIILAYVPSVSFNNLYWSDALHTELKDGIQDSWWLRDASGAKMSIWPGTSALNLTSGWTDYLASFVADEVLGSGLWDGVFYDEVNDSIAWVGSVDLDRNGSTDNSDTADSAWKNGYKSLFDKTRDLVGDEAIIISNGSSDASYSPFVNGRMFESFPTPWEGNGAWSTVMKNYLRLEDEVAHDPVMVLNGNTDNTGNQTDYRDVRFGITSTLLGNGYFGYDFGTESHNQLWTYDEYDAFLGDPKGDPEDVLNAGNSTLTESVWTRDFTNGKVLVNATGNEQSIRLDGEYEKLHGDQDPSVNNGGIVSRVTLPAKDGIILLRPIEAIEDAAFINGSFARIFGEQGEAKRTGFFAYDSAYTGGQTVIHYDTDLDGKRETIVANDSRVQIFEDDGSLHATFYPYTEAYDMGVNIAVGDIENDGSVEIVTGTERGGGPQIRIFNKDGNLIHPGFFAYDTAFRGGVNVAIGDLNGDNVQEIIAGAGVGGGPHVRVFNKDGKVINPGFFAYDESFRGGVNVAVGDIDANGIDEIVTAPGAGGGPHVRVYDRDGKMSLEFFAFDSTDTRGVELLTTDVEGDGFDEIVTMSADVFTFSLFE